jgi:hypothetical protein
MRALPVTRLLHANGVVASSFERRSYDRTTVIHTDAGPLVIYWPDTYPSRGATLDGRSLSHCDLSEYRVHEPALAPPTLTPR